MMGISFLGVKDVKMSIYHCINGYKVFGRLLDPRGHPDPYDSFRMIPSPLVPRLIAPYPRLYHSLLFTLSVLFSQQGLYTDSIEMAHEGVQTCQEDRLTQDKFRELMEMGLKAENERVGREEQIQEKAHKQAGVSWGGVYRDHGIFQNAEKSKEATVPLGRNKLLRVDSVRQEVSLLNHDMLKSLQKKRKILEDLRSQKEKSSKKKEGPPRLLRATRSMDLSTQAYKEAVEDGLFDKSFQETGRKGINSSVLAVMAAKKSGNFNPADPSVLPQLNQIPKLAIAKVSPPPSEYRLPNINYKLEGALSTDREPFKPSWSKKSPDNPKESGKAQKQPSQIPSLRLPSQEHDKGRPEHRNITNHEIPAEPPKAVVSKSPVPISKPKPQPSPVKLSSGTPDPNRNSKPANLTPIQKHPSTNPKPQQPRPHQAPPQTLPKHKTPAKPSKPAAKAVKHPQHTQTPDSPQQLDHSQEGVQLEADNLTHERTEPQTQPHDLLQPTHPDHKRNQNKEHSGSFTLKEVARDFRHSSSVDVKPLSVVAAAAGRGAKEAKEGKGKDDKHFTEANRSKVSVGRKTIAGGRASGSRHNKAPHPKDEGQRKASKSPERSQEQEEQPNEIFTSRAAGEQEFRFDIDSSRAELPRRQSESGGLELSGSVQRSVPRPDLDDEGDDTAPEFYITKIEVYY